MVGTKTVPSELIRAELEGVEEALRSASASEVEVLQEAARHILSAGGKRVRPQLTLLTTLALGGPLERAIGVAAACELVHTATLVHDDIVDESDSRRGRMSVQFYFGNSASVLMGDYLVVRAFHLVSGEDREIWNIMVDTIARMCEGEVLQICVKGDTSIGVPVYETIIECKTALLISACTRYGALLSGAPAPVVRAMTDFGYRLGMAFQIQDDILDFTGTEASLGKPVGGDLREGKVTLPVIFALQEAVPEDREELLRIYQKAGALDADEVRHARQIIERSRGFERARRLALDHVEAAARELEALPSGEAREALLTLARQVVDRQH